MPRDFGSPQFEPKPWKEQRILGTRNGMGGNGLAGEKLTLSRQVLKNWRSLFSRCQNCAIAKTPRLT
jgi:hypothetical protein